MTTRREIAVETDTKLAAKYDEMANATRSLGWAGDKVHRAAGDRKSYVGHKPKWGMTTTQALATCTDTQAVRAYQDAFSKIERLRADIGELDAIYRANGRWNRYFLVTNANGHVHRGMNCKTCFTTTLYAWLVELADCDEDAMITEFGEKACTVCFPDAPANPKFHGPGRRDAEAQAAKAAEKDARQAAKDAKQLTEGEQFRTIYGRDRVTTVAACKEVIRKAVDTEEELKVISTAAFAKTWTGDSEQLARFRANVAQNLGQQKDDAELATRVLLAREAAHEGWGMDQPAIDKMIASKAKSSAKAWARS